MRCELLHFQPSHTSKLIIPRILIEACSTFPSVVFCDNEVQDGKREEHPTTAIHGASHPPSTKEPKQNRYSSFLHKHFEQRWRWWQLGPSGAKGKGFRVGSQQIDFLLPSFMKIVMPLSLLLWQSLAIPGLFALV